MDIRAYIRELLFEHDCVIIPGFGGFIGNYSPARADRNTGTFFPPLKQITFNRNLRHNDGLLISKISLSAGLKYGDARHAVEEFVMDLTGKLLKGERVVFDHLGTFRNNHENNLQFEPEANINYYPGSYGLESFHCLPARDYDVRRRVTRRIDREPAAYSSSRRNLWKAAVLIPVLALLIAVPLKTDLFRIKTETTSLNPLVTAEFENNRKAVDESAMKTVAIDSSAFAETAPVEPSGPVEAPVVTASATDQYSVITGSFQSEENAVSHVESLREEGFNPEISQAPNGFFRVTAATCRDLRTAISTRDSVIKKYPGAWVSKR